MSHQRSKPVLIIVDMLVDFFDPEIWLESDLPDWKTDLVENLKTCLQAFRTAGCPVIWIKQAFEPDLSDAFPHMRRTGKAYTIRGTKGAEILPQLEPRAEDIVVYKKRFSAFFGTDLQARLQSINADTLVLAGITTSWCIRSTATDAYQRDYAVVLCKDCMGGFRTADHERDLLAMDGYIASAISSAELEGFLNLKLTNPIES